jgi:ABC-2 type transport system ATP-binding protein
VSVGSDVVSNLRTSDAGTPLLEVRGVERAFDGRPALQGVDLGLRPGEIYGLLGPNGAGKTSLIRAICGRLRLDGGSVRLQGQDPARHPEARRRLGLVPQDIALFPDLTARENLEVFGRLLGLASREARSSAASALETIGLADRADDRLATLSGGMRRRVNIAAGILHRPAVLLLDEPTVGVDPSAREAIHELLRRLWNEGLAILLTTHDLDQAEELAHRVGVLVEGRIRAEGSPGALIRETFGESKEVAVVFSGALAAPGRAVLEELGLEPAGDGTAWTGPLGGGLDTLSDLGRRLSEAGVAVGELRVREPGLRGVYFRLTGEELRP